MRIAWMSADRAAKLAERERGHSVRERHDRRVLRTCVELQQRDLRARRRRSPRVVDVDAGRRRSGRGSACPAMPIGDAVRDAVVDERRSRSVPSGTVSRTTASRCRPAAVVAEPRRPRRRTAPVVRERTSRDAADHVGAREPGRARQTSAEPTGVSVSAELKSPSSKLSIVSDAAGWARSRGQHQGE